MIPLLPYKPVDVRALYPYLRHHYAKPGNTLGGCFHIMTEDPNPEQHHAESCLESAVEEGDPEAIGLGIVLCCASTTQRRKLHDASFYPPMVYWRHDDCLYGFAGYLNEAGELFDAQGAPGDGHTPANAYLWCGGCFDAVITPGVPHDCSKGGRTILVTT